MYDLDKKILLAFLLFMGHYNHIPADSRSLVTIIVIVVQYALRSVYSNLQAFFIVVYDRFFSLGFNITPTARVIW